MSGGKSGKRYKKSGVFQGYIKYILSFNIIAVAVFITAILIAMKPVSENIHKIENKLNMQVRDIVINDDCYLPDENSDEKNFGDKIGNVIIENCGLNCDIYYGSNRASMRYGAGFLSEENDFGSGRLSVIRGYNETCFSSLGYVKKGDIVTVTSNNGVYNYRVNDIKYIDANTPAYKSDNMDMLILCGIFSDLSEHSGECLYVFADRINGEVG